MQTPEQDDRLIGRRFGRFLLTRKLGEGGMGSVYLATRVGEFEQTVAVKLLLDGRQHEGLMARFRAERQVLAALNHPGIVQLIDGGVSEDGVPFLVMDYVDGVPLDEFCEVGGLPVAARIEKYPSVWSCMVALALARTTMVARLVLVAGRVTSTQLAVTLLASVVVLPPFT